jgi:hypothetical protein
MCECAHGTGGGPACEVHGLHAPRFENDACGFRLIASMDEAPNRLRSGEP